MDPRQKPRLVEIIQNLRERIREARANGRLGEVQGLQVSPDGTPIPPAADAVKNVRDRAAARDIVHDGTGLVEGAT